MEDFDSDTDDESIRDDAYTEALMALDEAIETEQPVEVFRAILDTTSIGERDLFELLGSCLDYDTKPEAEILELLIRHNHKVTRVKDDADCYLLHKACFFGAPVQILELLLELNPTAVRKKNLSGILPLHYALHPTAAFFDKNIKLVLSHYPDSIHEADNGGKLPLHLALDSNAPDDVTLTFMEQYPEAARIKDKNGNLPIHYAGKHLKITKELIKICPESITALNDAGNYPFHETLSDDWGSLDVVKYLAEQHPASVTTRGDSGCLPLHFASTGSQTEIMTYLIDMYPDAVSLTDSNGRLPIHHACRSTFPSREVVQLLLDRHQSTHHGLDVVDNDGNIPILSLFGSSWAWVLQAETETVCHLLLETYPESARIRNRNGMLPLHMVFSSTGRHFHAQFVRDLVDIDILTVLKKDGNGMTPLELASGQSVETRQILIEKQDEAARLMRDAVQGVGVDCGLPDLVVSTVCSFMLPRIQSPMDGEMIW